MHTAVIAGEDKDEIHYWRPDAPSMQMNGGPDKADPTAELK